jgi:hypothetical protein
MGAGVGDWGGAGAYPGHSSVVNGQVRKGWEAGSSYLTSSLARTP